MKLKNRLILFTVLVSLISIIAISAVNYKVSIEGLELVSNIRRIISNQVKL